MNIEDLKFKEIMQLMLQLDEYKANIIKNGVPTAIVESPVKAMPYIDKYVVVRTYAAGVHVGVLKDYDYMARTVILTESRRIWSWEGAFTLSAVATQGITGGKIAVPLDELLITQVEEIIPCSAISEKNLRNKEAHKP